MISFDEVKNALSDILKEHIDDCISQICAKQDVLENQIQPLLHELSRRQSVRVIPPGSTATESSSYTKTTDSEQIYELRGRYKKRRSTAPPGHMHRQADTVVEELESKKDVSAIKSHQHKHASHHGSSSENSLEKIAGTCKFPRYLPHLSTPGRGSDDLSAEGSRAQSRTSSMASMNYPVCSQSIDSRSVSGLFSGSTSFLSTVSKQSNMSIVPVRSNDTHEECRNTAARPSIRSLQSDASVNSSLSRVLSIHSKKLMTPQLKSMRDVDLLHTDLLIAQKPRASLHGFERQTSSARSLDGGDSPRMRAQQSHVNPSRSRASRIDAAEYDAQSGRGSTRKSVTGGWLTQARGSTSSTSSVGWSKTASGRVSMRGSTSKSLFGGWLTQARGSSSSSTSGGWLKRLSWSARRSGSNHIQTTVSADMMRNSTDMQMLQEIDEEDALLDSFSAKFFEIPRWMMCICGVLPFGTGVMAKVYCLSVLIVAVIIATWSVALATWDLQNAMSVHLCTACYAIGALLGLLGIRATRIESVLGPVAKPLETHAWRDEWFRTWHRKSMQRFMLVFVIWLTAGISRSIAVTNVVGQCWDEGNSSASMHLLCFWVVSGLLVLQTYSQLYTSSGLELMVDDYCIRFFADKDVPDALMRWNVIQAFLRRSASMLEPCIWAVATSQVVALLLTGLQAMDGTGPLAQERECAVCWGTSVLLPFVSTLYSLLRAAAVTEKCSRVPSLINSIILGPTPSATEECGLDEEYRHLVEYITISAAGFYVHGMRITAFMALKLIYIFGFALLTLSAHVARKV